MNEFREKISDFLTHCRFTKNLSPHTLRAYQSDLNQFVQFVLRKQGRACWQNIDKTLLQEYLQFLQQGNKKKTIKRKIATLKILFNYLEFEDIIPINPFRKLRIKIPVPLRLPDVLSLKEIQRLFQAAYERKQRIANRRGCMYRAVVRDIAVMELLFATGIRVAELCNLKRENTNISKGRILVKGKGNRERVIQVCNQEVLDILRECSELFHANGCQHPYFFINQLGNRLSEQSVRFMIKKYAELADLQRVVTPHLFRHTFATLLLEEGVDIRYIQQLLGHSTITTTQLYTHVSRQHQEAILAQMHPRGKFSRKKFCKQK